MFVNKVKKQPPLRKVVYEQLKSAILKGNIPGGTKLCETKIAEEMGISRTPVREALHALEREFIIIGRDKVGYEIADISPDQLEEISEIRKTVEILAIKKAMDRIGKDEIRQLEDNLKRSEEAMADGIRFITLDAEFHRTLCSFSHSERLTRMADTMREEMMRFRGRMKEIQAVSEGALRHHRRIVKSLKERDYAGASRALSEHIDYITEEYRKMSGARV